MPARPPSRSAACVFAGTLLCACGGGSGAGPGAVIPGDPQPAIAGSASAGAADGLAGALWLSAGKAATASPHAGWQPVDPELAAALAHLAQDHLRSAGLGAGGGPGLAGSRRIQRLALLPEAPPDGNGDGSNWDETLAAEAARVAAFAGAPPSTGAFQPLFPWHAVAAELAAPLPPGPSPGPVHWRTRAPAERVVRLADAGGAMTARALLAGALLAPSRGSLAGATAVDGALGLELAHQLLAAEETLLGALFTGGGALGALPDPENYDPAVAPRWLPAEFTARLDPAGTPLDWQVLDGASDLVGLADVLTAAAELDWLAADDNPWPSLRDLFRGGPFGPPGGPRPPRPLDEPTGSSWNTDIGPLMRFRCGGCHLGFGAGGFVIDTLPQMLAGSPRTRAMNLPMVVPGDHPQSFLWRILVGPPPPFQQMPQGSRLAAGEIQLIADWIDAGAPENPVELPAPPRPGAVLARASFLNLAALHLDLETGALHHRNEGDGRSGIATAQATGRALQALALLAARPDSGLNHRGSTPPDALAVAAAWAGAHLLDADGLARDWVGIDDGSSGPVAELGGQAALTAGLLAASARLRTGPLAGPVDAAAQRAAAALLDRFRQPSTGLFRPALDGGTGRYHPDLLRDLLTALRLASLRGVPEAAAAHDHLLRRLRPLLAHAEWDGRGEVLGDGIADTDGNGIPEPAAAGGDFGRLPLLAGGIQVGPVGAAAAAGAVTWTGHVRPLLAAACGECHLHGNDRGGYRMDTLRALATAGESGGVLPLLVPGDPDASFFYRKLVDRRPAVGAQMPLQRPPLDDRARNMVRSWILDGARGR